MKKLFVVLCSFLMVLSTSMMHLFADELSDFEKLAMGDKNFNVGDVIEIPLKQDQDGGDYQNSKFLIIGKDEDLLHSYTLMAIDNLGMYYGVYDEDYDLYAETTMSYADLKNALANGTYTSGDVESFSLLLAAGGHFDDEGLFFTTKDLETITINYANSTIDLFSQDFLEGYTAYALPWNELYSRIAKIDKAYLKEDGSVATKSTKFWWPSLVELGFESELSADENPYSLFEEKDFFEYTTEQSIAIDANFEMWSRDVDYENEKLINIVNATDSIEEIDMTTQERYATSGFGFCFTVMYDEETTTYDEVGAKNVALYASVPSEYYIVMPTKVYVNSDAATPFTIRAYGDIESSKKIQIAIPATVDLIDSTGKGGKSNISVATAISKSNMNYKEVNRDGGVTSTITLTAPTISAGTWNANLEVTISLN